MLLPEGTPIIQWARMYIAAGYSLVKLPNYRVPSKRLKKAAHLPAQPMIPWRRYQEKQPTPDRLKKWWQEDEEGRFALVCGYNGLVVLDFDDPAMFAIFLTRAEKAIGKTVSKYIATNPFVTTGRGYHAYMRVTKPPDTRPLVEAPAAGADGVVIDKSSVYLLGANSYVVVPPSLHDNKTSYSWISSEDFDIPLVRMPTFEKLIKIAEALTEPEEASDEEE